MGNIVEKMLDLHKQATTEKSHYYVAKALEEAIIEINRLRGKVNLKRCKLMEVDLEEDWAKISVPHETMAKGFTPGDVLVDFTEVQ